MSTHSYHDHRDESENYDEDENDDDTEEENLSLKPLNAAFRPFHCSFQSDSKFIVPSNTNWFDNQTMSKNHHWSSTRTDFCSHGVQQKNAKSKERLKPAAKSQLGRYESQRGIRDNDLSMQMDQQYNSFGLSPYAS